MPCFELMTAKVVEEIMGYKLMHFPVKKELYYEKDVYGTVTYLGWYATNKAAKAMWHGELRSKGVHV